MALAATPNFFEPLSDTEDPENAVSDGNRSAQDSNGMQVSGMQTRRHTDPPSNFATARPEIGTELG